MSAREELLKENEESIRECEARIAALMLSLGRKGVENASSLSLSIGQRLLSECYDRIAERRKAEERLSSIRSASAEHEGRRESLAEKDRERGRLDERLAHGMLDEVRNLHENRNVSWEKLESFGLEYREVSRYLQGKAEFGEMRNRLLAKIRQFAKRQDIFFRKLEREGHEIYWLRGGREPSPEELIERFLRDDPLPPVPFRMCETFYGRRDPQAAPAVTESPGV